MRERSCFQLEHIRRITEVLEDWRSEGESLDADDVLGPRQGPTSTAPSAMGNESVNGDDAQGEASCVESQEQGSAERVVDPPTTADPPPYDASVTQQDVRHGPSRGSAVGDGDYSPSDSDESSDEDDMITDDNIASGLPAGADNIGARGAQGSEESATRGNPVLITE